MLYPPAICHGSEVYRATKSRYVSKSRNKPVAGSIDTYTIRCQLEFAKALPL